MTTNFCIYFLCLFNKFIFVIFYMDKFLQYMLLEIQFCMSEWHSIVTKK